MLNRFLICNSYELYGSFDNLRKTEYFESIAKLKGSQYVLDENLYRMLGYRRIVDFSYEDSAAFDVALVAGDTKAELAILKKYGYDSADAKDLRSFTKMYLDTSKIKFDKRLIKHVHQRTVSAKARVINMCVKYLFNSDDIQVDYHNVSIPLNDYLNILCASTDHVECTLCDLLVKHFEIALTLNETCVSNGTLYLNKKDWPGTVDEFAIHSLISKEIALRKSVLFSLHVNSVTEITQLWAKDISKYTKLLSFVKACGLTIPEFYNYCGIGLKIVDQSKVFDELSMCMYSCGNALFYVLPGGEGLSLTTLDALESVIQKRDMYVGALNNMQAF